MGHRPHRTRSINRSIAHNGKKTNGIKTEKNRSAERDSAEPQCLLSACVHECMRVTVCMHACSFMTSFWSVISSIWMFRALENHEFSKISKFTENIEKLYPVFNITKNSKTMRFAPRSGAIGTEILIFVDFFGNFYSGCNIFVILLRCRSRILWLHWVFYGLFSYQIATRTWLAAEQRS